MKPYVRMGTRRAPRAVSGARARRRRSTRLARGRERAARPAAGGSRRPRVALILAVWVLAVALCVAFWTGVAVALATLL
jgi:hypothetical protein